MTPARSRLVLRVVAILATVLLGLATRKAPGLFPGFIAEYGGDTLYATLWVQLVGLVVWRDAVVRGRDLRATWQIALTALLVCFVVEFSQALDVAFLNVIRTTTLGALVLGRGFLASDLACYVVGSGLGWGIEAGLRWRA